MSITEQEGDRRNRLAAIRQAIDETLEVHGAAAERRQINRMRAGTGQNPLIGEVLLPVNRGSAAEVVQVIELAVPGGADAVGDRVLAMEPCRRAALDDRLLRKVVAGIAEVAAGVVDPGTAVLPGSAALEGDAHRRVRVGRVDLVADRLATRILKEMRERDAVHGQARDAAAEEMLGDRRLEDLAPR